MNKTPRKRLLFVYMTAGSAAAAERLAAALVEERLAACANVLPGIRSVYRWQGAIERADEAALIVKTRADRFEALRARVQALHEYEIPCIVAWPITRGHPPFLQWVAAESAPARGRYCTIRAPVSDVIRAGERPPGRNGGTRSKNRGR
jgi:periplasmic divalent cation tolerance protein